MTAVSQSVFSAMPSKFATFLGLVLSVGFLFGHGLGLAEQ
jgi:hypothetical protein